MHTEHQPFPQPLPRKSKPSNASSQVSSSTESDPPETRQRQVSIADSISEKDEDFFLYTDNPSQDNCDSQTLPSNLPSETPPVSDHSSAGSTTELKSKPKSDLKEGLEPRVGGIDSVSSLVAMKESLKTDIHCETRKLEDLRVQEVEVRRGVEALAEEKSRLEEEIKRFVIR